MKNIREKIEPYLLDTLDKESMQDFEQAMKLDKELAIEVEQMRCIISSFERHKERQAFEAMRQLNSKDKLKQIIKRAENRKGSYKRLICLWSAAAVAATVILMVYIGMQYQYSPEKLYSSYFSEQQHFETTPTRGGSFLNPQQAEKLALAAELYKKNDYKAAATIYRGALSVSRTDIQEEAYLYYAISLMQIDSAAEAAPLFKIISDNSQAELQYEATWNLALAQLKMGRRDEATATLDKLIKTQSPLAAKADELKIKINKRIWF